MFTHHLVWSGNFWSQPSQFYSSVIQWSCNNIPRRINFQNQKQLGIEVWLTLVSSMILMFLVFFVKQKKLDIPGPKNNWKTRQKG